MKIIGITGLTGAGKGTVAQRLVAHGAYHINADRVARDVINNSETVKKQLQNRFGDDIIGKDGEILRPVLASRAFLNEESTNDLNKITHPAVTEKIKEIIVEKENENYRAVIIDAIALFESGEAELCDFTVAVVAPMEIRLERIMQRDNITLERAMERINAQKDESFFTRQADFILRNYPPYDLNKEILPIVAQIN